MKKLLSVLCGAVMAFSAVTCSATVSSDKIALGGVRPGMTASEVVRIAGQPASKSHDGEKWFYKDFVVEFDDDSNTVEEISTKSNGVVTPNNIAVGQNERVLSNTYGAADKVKQKHNYVTYIYLSTNYRQKLEFTVANGVIVEIECTTED